MIIRRVADVMEQMIMALAEKTLIGAAFVYLLFFIVGKLTVGLSKMSESLVIISGKMVEFGNTLKDISNTLNQMDRRMEKLEQRVSYLEVETHAKV